MIVEKDNRIEFHGMASDEVADMIFEMVKQSGLPKEVVMKRMFVQDEDSGDVISVWDLMNNPNI